MDGYFRRRIEATLRRGVAQFPAVVLTGPRRSGKTFLLRHLYGKKWHYVSLDDPEFRRAALDDPRAFLEDHPTPLILDEIQQAPALLPLIKLAIDENRDIRGRFLITGAQTFAMMQGVSES